MCTFNTKEVEDSNIGKVNRNRVDWGKNSDIDLINVNIADKFFTSSLDGMDNTDIDIINKVDKVKDQDISIVKANKVDNLAIDIVNKINNLDISIIDRIDRANIADNP